MTFNNDNYGTDESNLDNHYQGLLNDTRKSMDSSGSDVKDNPHQNNGTAGKNPTGFMSGPLMNWTQILESLDNITSSIENQESDVLNQQVSDQEVENIEDSEKRLLDKLNQIFTPILIMQGFENDVPQKIQEAMEQGSVLTERNIIQFDDATRMAQLISTCAILLQQEKNTEKYQAYQKAARIRNQMKLDMQKEEYDNAKALAQKYLVMVATSNNSSVARSAANNLLPETQH